MRMIERGDRDLPCEQAFERGIELSRSPAAPLAFAPGGARSRE